MYISRPEAQVVAPARFPLVHLNMGQNLSRPIAPPQQIPATPHLLGIPIELRLSIIKDVLESKNGNNEDNQLRFHDGIMIKSPKLLHVCKELREQTLSVIFKTKVPTFKTFGELGMALIFSPKIADCFTSVRVERCGSRIPDQPYAQAPLGSGPWARQWELESGLAMIARLPNLKHIYLEGASLQVLVIPNDTRPVPLQLHPEVAHPATVQAPDPLPTVPRGKAWRREEVLMRDLCDITWQVAHALTDHHPTLETFEIEGEVTDDMRYYAELERLVVRRRFREVCRMDVEQRKWTRELSNREPLGKK